MLGLAAAVAVPVMSPASAADRWQHHGGWNGGHDWHRGGHDWHGGGGGGIGAGGVLLGLGLGAALGAGIAASQAPAYYAPPPAVYYGG
jgi:hypothetical protein